MMWYVVCAVRVFLLFFCPSVLGVDMLYNVVGYCVILVACAQILEMKCSNQPNGCVDGRGCHRYSLVSTM